ncbi:MAG: hypothetical protein G01um10143_320 [Parcubacteria group bacterium Gr01-1014_3]|nr:MAG: hypothetical protein G01um10143_320 [Parcubacteria group bacterium Gr01-1014_3]
MLTNTGRTITFPEFSGIRCLMMPYIQGRSASIPDIYAPYREIVDSVFLRKGDIGFLTIDESLATEGKPHRGQRAQYARALHTEAGRDPNKIYYGWGGGWGKAPHRVTLDRGVRILLANNLDESCAVWDGEHEDTSPDGDIGHAAAQYPYRDATFLRAGDVHEIGILTPHESLPVPRDFNRQFLRIISSGVHGREEYFTRNPLVPFN